MPAPRPPAAFPVTLLALALSPAVFAQTPPAEAVARLEAYPPAVRLLGSDDAAQLVVTAILKDGRALDVTGDVRYEAPAALAVTAAGRVSARATGTAPVTAVLHGLRATASVTAERVGEDLPISFPNQVVPIFSKLSCNGGGCHGKSVGQNGFRLSLLGFEPELDYVTLVKESRGRRLLPAAPDHSLFLLKAAGRVPHGGGKKMDPDGDEYRLVRRWIASGTPYGSPNDPTVTKLSVYPPHRVLARNARQQFAVYAHYSDGRIEDVTRRAQYECNDADVATVDAGAVVRTLAHAGEAAVMARFQGFVAVCRVTVPLGLETPNWDFPAQSVVDGHTSRQWRQLGLVPSERCSDEVFVRRVSLDLTGTLPTPTQVTAFAADTSPAKRDALVDRLLASKEHAYFFANKWADILRVKRRTEQQRLTGTFGFHDWIRDAIERDVPYDQFARGILTATGDEDRNPPVMWYRELTQPEQFVDDITQVFLGQRLACAQCHHHPYEKWGQDDYWGLAAYFGRLGRKNVMVRGTDVVVPQQMPTLFVKSSGDVPNKRTGQAAPIRPLDGPVATFGPDEDPRAHLADWMTDPKNPYFARAAANRYWAHFFGRGIVDPLDDMRVTNPPTNPELLDALSKVLVDSGYSLRALTRAIVMSRTYQLSSVPNRWNQHDKQAYARYYPRRLPAEVLSDAVSQVTGSPTHFGGLPRDRNAPVRAIMLPDEGFTNYFLEAFGKPGRISACECERTSEANLTQALYLLNAAELQEQIGRGGSRAEKLAGDPRPDAAKVEELFLWAFARKPSPADQAAASAHLQRHAANKRVAWENLVWALVNTKEFLFNQ